jgi:hypothetical protein
LNRHFTLLLRLIVERRYPFLCIIVYRAGHRGYVGKHPSFGGFCSDWDSLGAEVGFERGTEVHARCAEGVTRSPFPDKNS